MSSAQEKITKIKVLLENMAKELASCRRVLRGEEP